MYTGQRRIHTGELLFFSGHEEDDTPPRTEGVAFVLSRVVQMKNRLIAERKRSCIDQIATLRIEVEQYLE